MKHHILYIIILLVTLSCKQDPIPKNAIPREEFVDILVDVHLAQAMYNDRDRINRDSLLSGSLYLSVLEKHKVSEEKMLTTTLYYSHHQKEYDKIFGDVLSNISLLIEEENIEKKMVLDEKKIKPEE